MSDSTLVGNAYQACPDCKFVRKCQSMLMAGWSLPDRFKAKLKQIAETGIPEEPPEEKVEPGDDGEAYQTEEY